MGTLLVRRMRARHVEAVAVRQPQVQHEQVGSLGARDAQG